ncbi:MAG: Bax inhibitor-1/YccA family protein [Phycisphaerales bacterium JB043]
MFHSSNPVLSDRAFQPAEVLPKESAQVRTTMTAAGAANKTFMLLGLCAAAAIFTWSMIVPAQGIEPKMSPFPFLIGGMLGGLVFFFITWLKPSASPFTAPIYALLEGLVLGSLSAVYALQFAVVENPGALASGDTSTFAPNYGMVFNALVLTFGILGVMLAVYRSGIIKVTDRFAMILMSAVGAVALLYLVNIIMHFFGASIPFIHSSGPIGIGFSVVVIGLASFMLLLDFEFIVRGAQAGLPRHMEWYAGFGLLVTLVWLYIEILHLLAKLQSRD